MPYDQYPARDYNPLPPLQPEMLAERLHVVNENMMRRSYTALPDREKLAEGRIKQQRIGLLIPPFDKRNENPLNKPRGVNGNVLAVLGLPAGQDANGEKTRREIAIVDFGPEAEKRSVAVYRYQDRAGKANIGQTVGKCRYGLTAYNYDVDGFVVTYIPLEPGKPVVLGRNTLTSEEYASSVLGLKTGAPDLAQIDDRQVTITAEANHLIVQDESQYGTDIAVIGDIFDSTRPKT